jgi:hypothetical protein
MNLRNVTFTLLALFGFQASSFAGPIEFGYGTGDITPSPIFTSPELATVLQPFQPPGPIFTFDPATNTPVTLPAVNYVPSRLPTPAAIDIHPDGTTHWNFEGYFTTAVTVMDMASGESRTVTMGGRAHVYNQYSTAFGWGGEAILWFQDVAQFTLGGNDYTIWGTNHYTDAPASVNIWVGANPPVHLTPEPGTFALFALGVAPFGLRRLRRMW